MTDRRDELRALAEQLSRRDGIADAYTPKSFTDRLFVIEIPAGERFSSATEQRLADENLLPASEVYGDSDQPPVPFSGSDGRDQFRYVDVESPGGVAVVRRRMTA